MSIEAELKFRVAPRKLSSLANVRLAGARRGDRSEQNLVSTYFDTTKHKLRRNGLTLRVRQGDDNYVQTVKAGDRRSSGPRGVGNRIGWHHA